MTGKHVPPFHDEMESLFVNNEVFDRVAIYLNRFNPIRVMGMERMEIRHSAILAWLLDPQETHGFSDRFLKAFISEALRGQSGLGHPTALEVSQSDLRDAEIRREWQNIDIFILSPLNKWAFIVENKYLSSQGVNQLAIYKAKIRSAFDQYKNELIIRGIFLTLLDEEPNDASYAPVRYASVCEFLPRIMAQAASSTSSEVIQFLYHYLEIIKDKTGMSEERNEMEKLAQQLYRDHKKVFDFVLEHGARTEFAMATEMIFGERPEYGKVIRVADQDIMYTWQNSAIVSFLPNEWVIAFDQDKRSWPGCEKYWAGYPLACWLTLQKAPDAAKGQLRLYAEVGPATPHKFRVELIDAITAQATVDRNLDMKFNKGATQEGARYSRFLKSNTVEIHDISDAEEISKGMKTLLKRFALSFSTVGKILPKFVEYGERVE